MFFCSVLTVYRLCELLIDSKFDSSSHVSRCTIVKRGIASNNVAFTNFHIPRSKTKHDGEDICMTDTSCNSSPVTAFDHHLSSNSAIPPDAPLFAFETGPTSWSPMTRTLFLNRCDEIWSHEGLSSVKGHGFRIGGTTHLLLLGVDPWIVMVQGRWSSQAFLGYWRKCEEILPMFIGFSFQSHDSILSSMSSFKNKLLNRK